MIFDEPISPKRCHVFVKEALRAGTLAKPRYCTRCGCGIRVLGHHKDYRKPLDVEWLCDSCHQKRHRPMIVPFCWNCRKIVFHRKECYGQRAPALRCGLCRKLGHSRIKCIWPRGLILSGPKCGRVLRRPEVVGRIARINESLGRLGRDALPVDRPGSDFVAALVRAALKLSLDPRSPRQFAWYDDLRNDCAALGDSIINAVLPGFDHQEAA